MRITLLGAGAWGTALAIAFAGKHEVTLWSREEDVAVDLLKTRENSRFFPGYRLPDAVAVSTDFATAVASAARAGGPPRSALRTLGAKGSTPAARSSATIAA